MTRSVAVALTLILGTAFAFAQDDANLKGSPAGEMVTVRGYVVDAMCAQGMVKKGDVMERAAVHTKECALEENCAASGFGVFSDGTYIKFDAHGDETAQELVRKTEKEKGIAVQVTGRMQGDELAVVSITETTMDESQDGDKADVKEGAVEDQQR